MVGLEVAGSITGLMKLLFEIAALATELTGVSSQCKDLAVNLNTLSLVLEQVKGECKQLNGSADGKSLARCLGDCEKVLLNYKTSLSKVLSSPWKALKWKAESRTRNHLHKTLESSKATLLIILTRLQCVYFLLDSTMC